MLLPPPPRLSDNLRTPVVCRLKQFICGLRAYCDDQDFRLLTLLEAPASDWHLWGVGLNQSVSLSQSV
jgi:hypothetical protein